MSTIDYYIISFAMSDWKCIVLLDFKTRMGHWFDININCFYDTLYLLLSYRPTYYLNLFKAQKITCLIISFYGIWQDILKRGTTNSTLPGS